MIEQRAEFSYSINDLIEGFDRINKVMKIFNIDLSKQELNEIENQNYNNGSMVEHPNHYELGRKYAPIKVIEDWDLNFNLGSAVKYISRAGRKYNTVEDLKKAVFYINEEIERLSEETGEEQHD